MEQQMIEALGTSFWTWNDKGLLFDAGSPPRTHSKPKPPLDIVQFEGRINCAIIIKAVAFVTEMKPESLVGPRRMIKLMKPRHAAIWLCYDMTECSLPQVGRAFGGRDHSTISHAVNKVNASYDDYREIIDAAKAILGGRAS